MGFPARFGKCRLARNASTFQRDAAKGRRLVDLAMCGAHANKYYTLYLLHQKAFCLLEWAMFRIQFKNKQQVCIP